MKILHITASYKPAYIYGGPIMSVSQLTEQLVKSGCEVEVFTTRANGTEELPVPENVPQDIDGVKVRYFKRITKDHTHFSPRLLATLWKEADSFDMIHIHAWWNLVSVLSCLIAFLRRVPVVVSPRGTLSAYSFKNNHVFIKRIWHRVVNKPLLNRCFIHTTSAKEQLAIAELIQPKRIFTIPNFVNFPEDVQVKETGNDVLKLIFLSRIDQKKGLELLFAALKQTSVPYRLTIAGSGKEKYIRELKNLTEQYQIDHQIDWVGFKGNDKFRLLAAHDLLVLPSYDENFGNVVIESLGMGTAVLISKEVGLAAYVNSNKLGWICETNVQSITSCLKEVDHQSNALDRIRQLAPAMIRNDFNGDHLVEQYYEMYKITTGHE